MTGAASEEARKLISALAASGCRTVLVSTPAKKVMEPRLDPGRRSRAVPGGIPHDPLGGNPWSVAVYIIVLSLLTAFAVLWALRRTAATSRLSTRTIKRRELSESGERTSAYSPALAKKLLADAFWFS